MPLLQSFPSVGQGEGGGNVNGYFNPADNLFYREDTYTTPIPGDQNTIYVSLDTNKIYRYNGTIFVPLGAAGEDPQVPELPQPSITEVNNIYQYTGPTNSTYKNGYFYKCIFNGTDYEWINVLVQPEGASTILTGTLLANGWSSKAQTVQIVGVDTDTKGVIGMLDTATTAQLTAAASAEISVTAVSNGTVTFTCENVPSIDIPFGILIPAGGSNSSGGGSDCSGELYLNTIYSEAEEKVGYWKDGKPLYQLTVELLSEALIGTNSWYTTNVSNANIDNIIFANGVNVEGSQFPLMANCDATASGVDYVQIGNPRYGDIRIKTFTIQYTKIADTPEVPQRGNVIYLPTIYSEEEREVGVWKDGKPLYQKSITLTHIPNKELLTINHGITNIDVVTEIKGTCFANLEVAPNYASTMLPRIQDNNADANMGIDVDRTVIYLKGRNENFEAIYDKIVVTLQYTKTTDTAGSGTWTPSGVPAVHYSTSEQVVGTWVDGKTLYEKTYYKNVTSTDTEIVVDSSIDKIWHIEGVNIQPSTSNEVAINYFGDGSDFARCYYSPSDHTLQIRTGSSYGQGDWYVTIRYTKTSS